MWVLINYSLTNYFLKILSNFFLKYIFKYNYFKQILFIFLLKSHYHLKHQIKPRLPAA
jgi:hypothetical protein